MKDLTAYEQKIDPLRDECPVRAALDCGTKRFSQLQDALPQVTAQALTVQLRQLEADGVVQRQIFAEVPLRVEYSLTAHGKELSDVMDGLEEWGKAYLGRQGKGAG